MISWVHIVNFENTLLSVFYYLLTEFKCGLLRSVSCTDRAIHAFPNEMRRFPNPRICSFELEQHVTPSKLYYSCSVSVSVLVLGQLRCYTCMQHFRLNFCETTSQARKPVQCRTTATACNAVLLHIQYSESACSVCTRYAFFGTLVR